MNRKDAWLQAKKIKFGTGVVRSIRMRALYALLALLFLIPQASSGQSALLVAPVSAASANQAVQDASLDDTLRASSSSRGGKKDRIPTPTVQLPTPTVQAPTPTATAKIPTPTATTGLTDLTKGRPSVASSLESSSYAAPGAVDDNTSTRWSSQFADPQWLSVDLGQAYSLNRVRLNWEAAYAKAYQLQVSNDATNWSTIYSTTNGVTGLQDLAVAGTGRYVRVLGTQRGTVWGYSLWELEVFGTSGASAPTPTITPPNPTPTITPPNPTPTITPPNPTPTTTAPSPTPTRTAVPPATSTPAPPATSTPAPTATATPTPNSSGVPAPMGGGSGWNLSFQDEFSGGGLDASRWTTCYPWWNATSGCTNAGNNELQWYTPEGVSVANGTAKLTAQKATVTGTNGKVYPYKSGMIASAGKFSYQYGFAEARVKLPAGKGLWPAFWMLPVDQSWPPEVDIFENWGNPSSLFMNVHYNTGSGNQQSPTTYTNVNLTEWHTIGLNWTPSSLTWYLDGQVVKTFTNAGAIPNKPMYLILNLAIDGNSPPDGSVPFPSALEIEYVRAWTK